MIASWCGRFHIWIHERFDEGFFLGKKGVRGFFYMIIREKDIASILVQAYSPRTIVIARVMYVSDGWIRGILMAGGKGAIGQENGVGDAGISFEADRIAQTPVVELAKICRRPTLQFCRTSKDVWRDELVLNKRAEMLI